MTLRIVPMQEGHLDALADISRLCFTHPWTREGLATELYSDTAYFLTAQIQEPTATICGFAGMHCVCGECYIDLVAVHPEYRRAGTGRALVRALTAYAQKIQAEFVTLEVRKSNAPAIGLYTSFGFEKAGERSHFYSDGEDALLLTRTL